MLPDVCDYARHMCNTLKAAHRKLRNKKAIVILPRVKKWYNCASLLSKKITNIWK